MDQQARKEFILEAFADPASVRDVVKGILHTIFFHRFFPGVSPLSREVLDIKLPYVADAELDTMVEKRADELAQRLDAERIHHNSAAATSRAAATLGAGLGALRGGGGATTTTGGRGKGGDGRGTITVQFFEKRRRKAWYGAGRDEEVCWESWTVRVTVAEPRTESERAKVRNAMEQTLSATVMKLVTCVNAHKDHIPPITTSDANPFPYQIHVNQSPAASAGASGSTTNNNNSNSNNDSNNSDGADAPTSTAGGWTARMGIY